MARRFPHAQSRSCDCHPTPERSPLDSARPQTPARSQSAFASSSMVTMRAGGGTDGEMRVCVRFLDGTGDQVGETIFRVVGQSRRVDGQPGNRSVHASPGNHRRATPRQEFLGGHVFGRTARRPWGFTRSPTWSSNPSRRMPLRPRFPCPGLRRRRRGTAAGGAAAGWMRDGLRPSMARVFESDSAAGRQGLRHRGRRLDADTRNGTPSRSARCRSPRATPWSLSGTRLTASV